MDIYAELDNFVEENEGQVTLTDVAKHFADYGYQYAVDRVCDLLADRVAHDSIDYPMATKHLMDDIRKEMKDRL